MTATRSLLLVALAAASTTKTLAFAPPSTSLKQSKTALFALEVVDDDEGAPEDPFEAYQTTEEQTTVVFKDTLVGSGYAVGGEESQQLRLAYKATFLDPKPGYQFDFSEAFVCKTGENKVLPGFEEGLKVRRNSAIFVYEVQTCVSCHTIRSVGLLSSRFVFGNF